MKRKILVIDDEEPVRNVMEKILIHAGYSVYTARNGVDALKKLEKLRVDIIMLDLHMPRMNGIEFLKALKETDACETPVLMVTGSSDVDLRIKSYKLGVYDFIKKPEDTEVMLKRIENGLNIRDITNFNRAIKSELIMANKLQGYLFPEPWAETKNANIFAWTKPVSDIGGDLYDYIILNNNKIIFFVSDISGHGISAALYTVIVKMLFRRAITTTLDPGEIITSMNHEINGNIPVESFITMFCGCFDPMEKRLEYANAGHPMPYLLAGENVTELEGNGPFMGPIKDAKFITYVRDLKDCRGLIAYTDGVMDIMSENDEKLGKRVILETLKSGNLLYQEHYRNVQRGLINDNITLYDDTTIFLMNFKF